MKESIPFQDYLGETNCLTQPCMFLWSPGSNMLWLPAALMADHRKVRGICSPVSGDAENKSLHRMGLAILKQPRLALGLLESIWNVTFCKSLERRFLQSGSVPSCCQFTYLNSSSDLPIQYCVAVFTVAWALRNSGQPFTQSVRRENCVDSHSTSLAGTGMKEQAPCTLLKWAFHF